MVQIYDMTKLYCPKKQYKKTRYGSNTTQSFDWMNIVLILLLVVVVVLSVVKV
jgi:hypothetical protein